MQQVDPIEGPQTATILIERTVIQMRLHVGHFNQTIASDPKTGARNTAAGETPVRLMTSGV